MLQRDQIITISASFTVVFVLYGIAVNCFPLFIIPITRDLGLTRSAYTISQSLLFLASMGGSAFGWKLYRRFGLMRIMRLSAALTAFFYFSQSFARSLPVFYVLSALIGFFSALCNFVPLALILRSWFNERVGLIIGLVFMGTGVGGVVFNPLANSLILHYGWQRTYQILALCMLVLSHLALRLLHPGPLSADSERETRSKAQNEQETGQTSNPPIPPLAYPLMFCTSIFSIAACTVTFTLTPHLQDIGYSQSFAALIASISMAALAVGKLLLGYVMDRHGSLRGIILSGFFHIAGLLGLAYAGSIPMLILALSGVLLAAPFGSVGLPVLGGQVAQGLAQQRTIAYFSASGNLGSALSPLLIAAVYQQAGTYTPLYFSMAIAATAAYVSAIFLAGRLRLGRSS